MYRPAVRGFAGVSVVLIHISIVLIRVQREIHTLAITNKLFARVADCIHRVHGNQFPDIPIELNSSAIFTNTGNG